MRVGKSKPLCCTVRAQSGESGGEKRGGGGGEDKT